LAVFINALKYNRLIESTSEQSKSKLEFLKRWYIKQYSLFGRERGSDRGREPYYMFKLYTNICYWQYTNLWNRLRYHVFERKSYHVFPWLSATKFICVHALSICFFLEIHSTYSSCKIKSRFGFSGEKIRTIEIRMNTSKYIFKNGYVWWLTVSHNLTFCWSFNVFLFNELESTGCRWSVVHFRSQQKQWFVSGQPVPNNN